MDSQYYAHYRELFLNHWWWRARSKFIVEKLEELPIATQPGPILDVGCGEGLFFDQLSRFGEVEGIELEEALSDGSRDGHRIYTCPFDESFEPGKQYSLILMLDVLEHLANPARALANVRRLLRPDGVFLATVPALPVLWTKHDELNHHVTRYTAKRLRALVESTGLVVETDRYFFHWTAPAKLVIRGFEIAFRSEPNVPRVPPAWVNKLLFAMTRLEQKSLSRAGFPIGSSLMLTATR